VDKGADNSSRINLVFTRAPNLQIKEWTAKDPQGFDTHVALSELSKADEVDPGLFNPATTRPLR